MLGGWIVAGVTVPDHVVVVGAGFVGLSTAWYLQEAGVKVTVVDRGGVAAGSSWGNAGWLTPALTLPIAEPAIFKNGLKMMLDPASPLYIPLKADAKLLRFLIGFAWHSTPRKWEEAMRVYSEIGATGLDAFDEIAQATTAGPGVQELTKPADPFLTGFTSLKDRDGLLHEFEMIEKTGGEVDYELLTGDELRGIEPTLSNKVAAGVAIKNQRYLNPPKFMESLAESVVARGGDIIGNFNVTDVRDNGKSVTIIGSEGRSITADHVVLATGAWMTDMANKFGVNVVVQAGRGYSFTVEPEDMPTHPIYFPAQRVACTPLGDRFRIAGTMEFRDVNHKLEPKRIEAIVAAATPVYKGINWENRKEEWVGGRPCTADGMPLVGQTGSARVSVGGGHGMWGVALGPLTGKILAAQITGQQAPSIARHFNPLRKGF
ncbi:NAD(P)/FAD-dependent oxidoreductase [Glutamicibacter arilaitensis]|jgi:D-amino-acid dehydrogenase|uniref:D-amino-acid dehydrogenase n=1 Tax=Glutamicibacter arilaitensis (strain DSM 16368 / CIP 108037 / IAM 15318 / JCM 13566 / NCIMB 14258 / Re117) TaxID=861360 RepID=A0ABM9PTL2_GLUAR|nr:FAD-dependent oxidoreductase [Glutamicibacter sp.]CBT74581.1 putative D-amino-acid dehydrogenase [Glutamicibacter arilaitensis Re117]HCH47542.1 FAD-binding oxidoreductase [Glutamicibacter sp.]